jgi:hemoglobin
MIAEYIRYAIDPSRNDEFDDAYRRAGVLLDPSPHYSAGGHLQGVRQSADFKPFLEAVQPFYNDIEEMTHYQGTAKASEVPT